MKRIFLLLVLFILIAGIFISCKKETSCEGCQEYNKPPTAVAGPDQVITLPTDSIALDGSASSDPDGKISEWLWKKIEGPASFAVIKPTDSTTVVKTLARGIYLFELTVTDNGGLFAKDTMQLIVNDPSQPNRPPVANAGTDQTIILPTNSVTVDGSGSTDPDKNISTYLWTKISGPSSFSFINANAVQTQVTNLVEGVYKFELKVTDAGGLFDRDTLRIIVNEETVFVCGDENRPKVNAQLIPMGSLSEPRSWISVAAAGDKILFNGGLGLPADCVGSNKVDIYDIVTNTWSVLERPVSLSVSGSGDYEMPVAVAGSKVFFAAGDNLMGCTDWFGRILLSYDAATNKWDSSDNSPVIGGGIAGASVGNMILFAGGSQGYYGYNRTKEVNIYNLSTNSWSSASLSEGRHVGHAAVAVNNKVYIIGGEGSNGFSSTMDIYDNATNAWSTGTMQKARAYFGAIAVNNKLYLAGGQKHSNDYTSAVCEVEIIDVNTGTSVIEYLSRPAKWYINLGQNIVLKDNKIIFLRFNSGTDNDKFDIYDINTKTWSIGALPQAIPQDASVISVNNTVYIAGGFVNGVLSSQVWKLEF